MPRNQTPSLHKTSNSKPNLAFPETNARNYQIGTRLSTKHQRFRGHIGLFPDIVPDAAFGDQRLGSVLKRKQYGIKQNLRTHPRQTLCSVRRRHGSPATENREDRLRMCFVETRSRERFFSYSTLYVVFYKRGTTGTASYLVDK